MTTPSLRYFLSGASGIRPAVMPSVAALIDYRLLSMHSAFKANTRVWCEVTHHKDCHIKEFMLDSGAFTAFMKGTPWGLEELCAAFDDTLAKLSKRVKQVWLINLDVIPGSAKEEEKDPCKIQEALDKSDDNFRFLQKKYGARVIPVYHQGEPESRLHQLLGMTHFLAMSARQSYGEPTRVAWAREAIVKAHKRGVLVHGLATTSWSMMTSIPWDAVDSATWLYKAAYGMLWFLTDTNELKQIAVSQESPLLRETNKHYSNSVPHMQKLLDAQMQAAGVTLQQLRTDLSYRILFNAFTMREWTRIHYARPVVEYTEPGLFPM